MARGQPNLKRPVVVLASASRTASGDSGRIGEVDDAKAASFFLDVTAAAGTSPTLDVVVETKDPASGKWFTIATFTQATGVTSERVAVTENMGHDVRVSYTIGGTGPDFTFSVGAVFENP